MLIVLLDPEKTSHPETAARQIVEGGVDLVFVGGSGYNQPLGEYLKHLRMLLTKDGKQTCPIVLFPGDISQFSAEADALLFLSLLSGRDAEMLIGRHIRSAVAIRESGIETIPMGYILVDGGRQSSVERVTKTKPLVDKQEIVSTALAGEMLGKQLIYLEAGSGAKNPVGKDIIRSVRQKLTIPLIVGGGICTVDQMNEAFLAGADIVVIGNYFEHHPEEISIFASAKVQK